MRDLQIGQRPVFVDGERDFDLRLLPDIVAIGRKPQVADHPDFEAFRTASLKREVHLFGPKAGRRTGVFSGGLFLSGGFRGGRSRMQRRKAEKHHKQAFHNKAGVLGFINIAKNARLATAQAQKRGSGEPKPSCNRIGPCGPERDSLSEERKQNARGDRRTDHAGHVGTHGVHQQEVRGIGLLALGLRHAGGHRDGRNAGRTDQRIDLVVALREEVHHLGEQHAAGGSHREGDHAQHEDEQRPRIEERLGRSRSSHRETQEDDDNVHQFVLHRLRQTVHHAALLHQVAQHETADERSGRRQQQRDDHGDDQREEDLLGLRHRTQLAHLDLTLLLGGQHAHDRRLDHRHEGHVGVGGHGDRAEQLGSQNRGQVDRRGTVGAADDADRTGLGWRESERISADEREENTKLRRGSQQEALGVGDQRAEVGHGAHAHEDKAGIDAELHAQIEVIEESRLGDENIPVDVPPGKKFRMVEVRSGKVRQQHAERDGQQQQRFELMFDGQVQQKEGHTDHNQTAPPHVGYQTGHARRFGKGFKAFQHEIGAGSQCIPHSPTRLRLKRRLP